MPPYTPTVHQPGRGGPQHHERVAIVCPAPEPIRIADLIYPDRYDLLSRAKYAQWCSEHRDLWREDELAFLEKVRAETTWGVECDMLTYMWQYWHRGAEWDYPGPHYAAFHADTRKFFGAIESLEANGWLPEGHIQIIWGRELLPGIDARNPPNYTRNWFMADAQHRVCVWFGLFGETEFAPEHVQVLDYRQYRPFVTTPAFLEVGLLPDLATFRRELYEYMVQIQG